MKQLFICFGLIASFSNTALGALQEDSSSLSSALEATTSSEPAIGPAPVVPTEPAMTSVTPLPKRSSSPSHWAFEGLIQAHSVAGEGSPWLGLSTGYNFNPYLHLGVRGFLPISKPVDKSTYSLQAYGRVYFNGTDSAVRLFFEPEYAVNFLELEMFNSMGAAVGVMDRLQRHLAVGLMGGVEVAQDVIDSIGLERTNTYAVYPKIAMLANFAF